MNGAYGRVAPGYGSYVYGSYGAGEGGFLKKIGNKIGEGLKNVDWQAVGQTFEQAMQPGMGPPVQQMPAPQPPAPPAPAATYPDWLPWVAVGGAVVVGVLLMRR